MAGRWKEVALQPVPGYRNGGYTCHMPDYAPRAEDHDWIARELGDVEVRTVEMVNACNLPVWVESLGRES